MKNSVKVRSSVQTYSKLINLTSKDGNDRDFDSLKTKF